MLGQVEADSIFECHGLLVLIWVSFHQFVELDALKWTHLPDVLLHRGEAATDTDHNLVSLDHQDRKLSSNLVLALVCRRFLLELDDGEQGKQDSVEFLLVHDLEELKLFESGLLRLHALLLSLKIECRLFGLEILWLVHFKHFLLNFLSTFKFKRGKFFVEFFLD